MRVLVKSAWGSDDPTKAAFPFLHANALAEAGHDAQIFLLGEAVSLMRDPVANAVVPGGLAAAGGDPSSNSGAWHTHPCLRRLFEGSWSPPDGSRGEESLGCQPCNSRSAC
jgi:hypothetical protein